MSDFFEDIRKEYLNNNEISDPDHPLGFEIFVRQWEAAIQKAEKIAEAATDKSTKLESIDCGGINIDCFWVDGWHEKREHSHA